MYKRPARILFAHLDTPQARGAAATALDHARLHDRWIEARTCPLERMAEELRWADLLVTLGECPPPFPLPPHLQHRHWPDLSPQALQQRIDGVVGGLRLLSQLDEDD